MDTDNHKFCVRLTGDEIDFISDVLFDIQRVSENENTIAVIKTIQAALGTAE